MQFGRKAELTRVADGGNVILQKTQGLIQSPVLCQGFPEQDSEVGSQEGRPGCAKGIKSLADERDRCLGLTARQLQFAFKDWN
jgi:hypothetical protein